MQQPKNVLILSGSPRKFGNSELLCESFRQGALQAGHRVRLTRIAEKNIRPCTSCFFCLQHDGICVQTDEMAQVLKDMLAADVIVLASPVYFFNISAQLKTAIDRCFCQYSNIRDKQFYFILSAADDTQSVMDTPLAALRSVISCFPNAQEKGYLLARGVLERGAIKGSPLLDAAFSMGAEI